MMVKAEVPSMDLPDQNFMHSRLPSKLRLHAALTSLLRDEDAQDLIEYGLIAGLIGLAAVTSAHGVAASVQNAINIISSELTSAI
jgi:pilus assembly protein Flp/PilA